MSIDTVQRYAVELTGKTPLLLHADDIEWADTLSAWKNNPANKKTSRAGDDRSPAWRWIGCLYHDGRRACIPQENVMRAAMEGAALVPVPGARNNKTFKSQSQSGLASPLQNWPLYARGAEIPIAPIHALMDEDDFSLHRDAAERLGFTLHIKRARIGQAKHIRVRPRIDQWMVRGELLVIDPQITAPVLADILGYAGQYKGLGDWRPGGKTPGPYGMFDARVERLGWE
jgi:hypothetical protein